MSILDKILYVWQLPQNLVGRHIVNKKNAIRKVTCLEIDGKDVNITYYVHKFDGFSYGVSLGQYIILPHISDKVISIRHEYGHCRQSLRWGPLYLITVGLVSGTRNLYARIFHKHWKEIDKQNWYYKAWPENEADKLGNVNRTEK